MYCNAALGLMKRTLFQSFNIFFFHFRIKMDMNYSKSSFFCILHDVMFREAGWSNESINYASNLLVNAQCLNDFQMIFL